MSKPRTLIRDSGAILKDIMRAELTTIGGAMVKKIMGRARGLTKAKRLDAIKEIPWTGELEYTRKIIDAVSEIAADAISAAQAEVPKAKNVRFTEDLEGYQLSITTVFSKLPKETQRFIKKQSDLLVNTQLIDLQQNLFYQYTDSFDTTDDFDVLAGDLVEAALSFIESSVIDAGANLLAAKTVNESRSAFFFQEDTLAEVDAFEFVNGDPQTEVCQDLAGTIFAKDDPEMFRYTPPLHWNCKSYIAPVLAGRLGAALARNGKEGIERLKPSTKKIEDQIQFSEKYLTRVTSCTHHG